MDSSGIPMADNAGFRNHNTGSPGQEQKIHSGEIDLEDGRMLYINRAIGHSFQVRFMVRPEITVFTFNSSLITMKDQKSYI
jgi:hypothetical protein